MLCQEFGESIKSYQELCADLAADNANEQDG